MNVGSKVWTGAAAIAIGISPLVLDPSPAGAEVIEAGNGYEVLYHDAQGTAHKCTFFVGTTLDTDTHRATAFTRSAQSSSGCIIDVGLEATWTDTFGNPDEGAAAAHDHVSATFFNVASNYQVIHSITIYGRDGIPCAADCQWSFPTQAK